MRDAGVHLRPPAPGCEACPALCIDCHNLCLWVCRTVAKFVPEGGGWTTNLQNLLLKGGGVGD